MNKFSRDEFISERSLVCSPLGATRYHAAEGGTSGKNSSTDQRQIQATSQEGPVLGGDGAINTGTSLDSGGGAINLLDGGAVDAAFGFAEKLTKSVFENDAANVAANNALLAGVVDRATAGDAGIVAANSNKTILYLGLGAAALLGLFFFLKR
jgi:hypothetical protein